MESRLLMYRDAWVTAAAATACIACGCSGVLGTIFQPQELSDNYATIPGTVAESHWKRSVELVPLLIDGDVETIGRTAREIVIRMPEERVIRRVVTRNSNYEDVILYVGGRSEGEWKMVTQIKQNDKSSIVINLSAVTDRIRLRIGDTFDDEFGSSDRRIVPGTGGRRQTAFKPGAPKAGEIELYGLRAKRSDEDVLF